MEELYLNIKDRLPYRLSLINYNDYIFYLNDDKNRIYHLHRLNKIKYISYYELIKSKYIERAIYEFSYNNEFYILFEGLINESDNFSKNNILLLENIHNDFKFQIKLNKENAKTLTNLYKVLDNKFSYLELRIREIETKPYHDDFDWIILSKYYIVLDTRIILYDIQNDIFKMIDKEEEEYYGIVFKNIPNIKYKNGLIEPNFDIYYGPIAALFSKIYLAYDHKELNDDFKKKLDKMNIFNKKYFFFISLYIYVLNLNLEIIPSNSNLQAFISITKRIKAFIDLFKDYLK